MEENQLTIQEGHVSQGAILNHLLNKAAISEAYLETILHNQSVILALLQEKKLDEVKDIVEDELSSNIKIQIEKFNQFVTDNREV